MALPPLRPGSHDGRRGQVTYVCAAGEKEIRPARAAGVPRASRAGSRRTHKPIQAIRSGSGGTVRPRQDEGRPPRRSLRIRWRSVSGGPREPGAHPFLPQRGTLEWRPQLRVMAAVPSPLSRFLPVCSALPDATLPMCLPVLGSVSAANQRVLGHNRAQDFSLLVGRERSSSIKRPLRPPSWLRPRNNTSLMWWLEYSHTYSCLFTHTNA
ncbi:hypothetical protein NDU88_004551 [Pleurodeles waltl]|uniref:Uncharacterized protein n=1 Tax=Pleurodeles waltl TaxID=8319 RepID=A0AAV7RH71_PLEWA|nr:hypothetical protein NDU88_004551 [Pleurodeles waltl]